MFLYHFRSNRPTIFCLGKNFVPSSSACRVFYRYVKIQQIAKSMNKYGIMFRDT